MWAELELDVYCGKGCDESEPRWHTFAEGDMDSDTSTDPIKLDATYFPPGTKVSVSIPECPDCQLPRMTFASHKEDGSVTISHEEKCDCGFDWVAWEQNEYS